jgi:hypothetical protein
MKKWLRSAFSCLAMASTGILLGSHSLSGQTLPADKKAESRSMPRTSDGRPDFGGVWNFGTVTPLERPATLADKEFLTPEEAARFVEAQAERRRRAFAADPVGSYNDVWFEIATEVVSTRRSSLITDPRDGKMPPLTAEAAKSRAAYAVMRQNPAGAEEFSLSDRCIVGLNTGPPMLPAPYNNLVQIFQSRDYIVIYNEMNHSARTVPLDGRPSLGSAIRRYTGESRGRWEGDTLIVETSNFPSKGASFGAAFSAGTSENLRIVERFTRTDTATLLYEFTVDDPLTWTRPWSGELPLKKSDDRIYEYACHEGNYAVSNMLSGARAVEKAAEASKRKR